MEITGRIKLKENQLEEIEGLTSEYPYVLHRTALPETSIPWHWHEEFEFVYIVCGSLKLNTSSQSYVFQQNEAFFINSNVLCSMECENEHKSVLCDSHLFHPVLLSGHFRSVFETKYIEPVSKNQKLDILEIRGRSEGQQRILAKLRKLAALQSEEHAEFPTRNLLSEIWLLLLEEMQALNLRDVPAKSLHQERIQTMMSYIHQHHREKITLEEIAQSAAVSKRECLRCFQLCIRKTPFEYLLDYRIDAAKRLLRTTKLPILEIALQTGFSSESYFCKVFKRLCNKTPNTYRKTYGN